MYEWYGTTLYTHTHTQVLQLQLAAAQLLLDIFAYRNEQRCVHQRVAHVCVFVWVLWVL